MAPPLKKQQQHNNVNKEKNTDIFLAIRVTTSAYAYPEWHSKSEHSDWLLSNNLEPITINGSVSYST